MWTFFKKIAMIIYALVFIYLSYLAVKDDVENNFPVLFTAWGSCMYLLMNVGNFVYINRIRSKWVSRNWYFVFIVSIVFFFAANAMDIYHYWDERDQLLPFFIGVLLFLPTFVFNYKLCERWPR